MAIKTSFITLFLLLASFFAKAQTASQPDSIYNIRDSVEIKTRNGDVISAIIIQKKTNNQALPAVLFYTTYLETRDAQFGKRVAERDYVCIIAYARGIKTDLKHYAPFENEGTDVYDIIDWISKQSWCNGKVGMFSGSYTGYSQWATAKKCHPALKTIVPQVAVMPGFDFPMENNVPLSHILSWPNDFIYKRKPLPRDLPFDYYNKGVSFRNLDSLAGQRNDIFQKWLQHPTYDNYWQAMAPTKQNYENIKIPILSTTGYYDGSQISALRYFKLHTLYNKNAEHYLVIGPYDHWGGQRKPSAVLMDYRIDSVALVSMGELAYQWLDYILKGKEKPALLKDKVNYQIMGTNTWKHAPSLQKINNDTLRFYLSNTKHKGSYLLDAKKQTALKHIEQKIDFKDRSDSTQHNFYTPSILFDSLDASNGLVFMTDPFSNEFSINGSFTGNLQTSITKKDMDVSMALYELTPEGRYFFLTRYVGRASYAKNSSKRQLLQPGKKESIPFNNTRMVSKKISKGSRLVILLNINKHPFEIINYGSGKEVNDETINDAGDPLFVKWFTDSFIEIPVWK